MGQITQPKGGNEVFYAAPLPSRLMSAKLSRNMMLVFSYNEIRNILFYCPTFQNVSWSVLVAKLWQQPTIFCASLSPFCLFTLVRASFAQFLNVNRWNLGSRLKCHIVAIGEKNRQGCPQRSNSPRLSYKIARCVAGLNCYEFKQIHVSVCNSKLKHLEREIKFRIFKWKLSAITCVALFLMNKTLEQTVDNFFPCPWARTQTHFLYLIVLNDFGLEITVFLFSNTKGCF